MTTTAPDAVLQRAGECLRNRDIAGARRVLDDAIAARPADPVLLGFAGAIACQDGDLDRGAALLRDALACAPNDLATRINLVRVLVQQSQFDEAAALCGDDDDIDPRLRRFRAHLRHLNGDEAGVAVDLAAVVAAFPDDADAWNNLGNAFAATDDPTNAARAFDRAIALRPRDPHPRINAAKAMARAALPDRQLGYARAAAAIFTRDAEVQYEHALALTVGRDFAAAEIAYRRVLSIDPRHVATYLELGIMLENLNRLGDLDQLIARADTAGVDAPEIDFLRGWSLRRRGRFADALPLAERAPETIDAIRRMHLIGEITDRLGDPDRAFAAFTAMNQATARATPPSVIADGRAFFDDVRTMATQGPAIAACRDIDRDAAGRPAPIFIAGFPRSGTTLLDTLLMNLPDLHVCEELPMMGDVVDAIGDVARIPTLDEDELARLRKLYFNTLDAIAPPPPGTTVVDKFPFHMVRAGLIHRLFPGARILFAERHPCDVLLSCFISNFQPNRAMVNFLDLESAARLYDAAFTGWSDACASLPLRVHTVRYERMVESVEDEMRALLAFLERPWDAAVTDNQASAARRGHIRTASYAQVGEKIYARSAGRWHRYREHLAPVLPMLAPWVERMGYSLDA